MKAQAKPAERARHGKRGTQRADVLAVRALDKQRDHEQRADEQPVGPRAVADADQECRLERFNLGKLLCQPHREHRHRQQPEEDRVLEPLQLVVPGTRQMTLPAFEAEPSANLVERFRQRAERAQPSAEQPSPKEEHRQDDEDPEAEDERIRQEQGPRPLEQQRVEPCQHLRDRRLRHRTKTN